jgi:ketosteroid isomerase-like protein
MSAANIELVRRGLEAYNRGDLDALAAILHRELEFRPSGIFPGLKPVYLGREGVREFWRDFAETWESVTNDVEDLRAQGDRVVALFTIQARGRDGIEVRRRSATVFTVRNGLAFRMTTYASWEEALQAAGMDQGPLDTGHRHA